MGWGRIDDRFDDHPKVLALLDEEDQLLGAAAIGLWSLCFTWAHRNTRKRGETPGRLPAGLPRRYLGGHAKLAAELLVKHNLWETQDDGAWLIHDFNDYLPTEETKQARSEAGKRGAAKRWAGHKTAGQDGKLPSASHDSDGKTDGNDMAGDGSGMAAETAQQPLDGTQAAAPRNGVHIAEGLFDPAGETAGDDGNLPSGCHDADSNGVANDGSRAPARRAIPKGIATRTHSHSQTSSSAASQRSSNRGTRIPADFAVTPAMVAWAAENAPDVDGRRETEKFINYWTAKTGRDATKRDWVATWRNWMLNAQERLPSRPTNGRTSSIKTVTNDPHAFDDDRLYGSRGRRGA
jgi:hypothetical protein